MRKVLFVATVVRMHINVFHTPYLKWFQEHGWETTVAAKNDYLKKLIDEEQFDLIYCHTPVGAMSARLASVNARKKGSKVV